MTTIYLSLGSNLGDLLYNLQRAKEVLQHRQWVVLETCSPVYVSEPRGKTNQPWFLNQVCRVEVPHPRLHQRRFVLVPLNDIAPDWRHPVLGKTAAELLTECPDTGKVHPL